MELKKVLGVAARDMLEKLWRKWRRKRAGGERDADVDEVRCVFFEPENAKSLL
jgi:hypothetical protein